MKHLAIAAALTAAGALAGCAEEAGLPGTSPHFGEATGMNLAAQQGHVGGSAVLLALSRDFQASTDEVVNFAFDRATLDAAARAALQGQARWLRAHPDVRMAIVGHTDLVGPQSYNFGLGLRRAQAALEYLVALGVDRGRLEALESRGELDPVVPTTAPERLNRRAETMVAGFVRSYVVGFGLDGVYAQRIYDMYQTGEAEVAEVESVAVGE